MIIKYRHLKELKPYKLNAKKHPRSQIEGIAESIRRFGFLQPVVVDKNDEIIIGHGRVEAQRLVDEDKAIPVIKLEDLTETEVKALRIIDNRIAETGWDSELIKLDLANIDFDFSKFNIDFGEILPPQEIQEDDFDPAAIDTVVTEIQLGDTIELGAHRIFCGDSSDLSTIETLMGGKRANIIFTDPPYGVSIGAKNRFLQGFDKHGRNLTDIKDDSLSPEELKLKLLPAFTSVKSVMAEDCTVFVTAPQGGELGMMMMMMMQEAGLRVRHVLIWKKNAPTFSMGRLDYDYQHEPILLTWGKSHKKRMLGKHRSSVWEIDKPRSSKEHPTMKPIELVANALLNNSDPGDILLDPFLGSGTSLLAAQQTGRILYGVEIEPNYCQVIINRYEAYCLDNNLQFKCLVNGKDLYGENTRTTKQVGPSKLH